MLVLRQEILELMKDCEPEIKEVVSRVVDAEWAMLSKERARGIIQEIEDIIDSEAKRLENVA